MKCPKCSYISYDMPDRCRNCGYDFPLASATATADLVLRDDQDAGPAPDFMLAPEHELPLFGGDRDAPLVEPSATPRTPLSVRRSPTDASRQRPVPKRDRRAPASRTPAPPVIVTPAAPVLRHDPSPLLPSVVVAPPVDLGMAPVEDPMTATPEDDASATAGVDAHGGR